MTDTTEAPAPPQPNGHPLPPEAAAPGAEYLTPAELALFAAAHRELYAARRHLDLVGAWLGQLHQRPGTTIALIADDGRIVRVPVPQGAEG